MTEKELWDYFVGREVHRSQPLRRQLMWVKTADFKAVENFFIEEFNILHIGRSFRSHGYFHHIHCVEQGEYVLVHRDMGNIARFFPLGIIHFFFDVLPYIVLAWIKRVSFHSFFTHPH